MKTAKRLIRDNTGSGGKLDCDEISRALLQYLNTPLRGVTESPAKIVFGKAIRDSLPSTPVRRSWEQQSHHMEMGMAKIKVASKERMDEKSKNLPPLKVGDYVQVQNQVGAKPNRWDKSGRIVETHGHRQYSVQLDGSRRVTLRNRKFLKSVEPLTIQDNVINYSPPRPSVMEAEQGDTAMADPTPRGTTTSPGTVTTPRPARTPARTPANPPVRRRLADPSPEANDVGGDCETEVNQCLSDRSELARTEPSGEAEPAGPRRGTRTRRQPSYLDNFVTKIMNTKTRIMKHVIIN